MTLRAVSGDVVVSNVLGELTAEAVSGSVTASGWATSAAAIGVGPGVGRRRRRRRAATSIGGAITVRRAKARTMDLRSMGGAVHVSESEADRVAMRALSGDIEFGGRISRNGRYDIESRTGRVVVAPVGSDGFEVEAATGTASPVGLPADAARQQLGLATRQRPARATRMGVRRRRRIADVAVLQRRHYDRAPLTRAAESACRSGTSIATLAA